MSKITNVVAQETPKFVVSEETAKLLECSLNLKALYQSIHKLAEVCGPRIVALVKELETDNAFCHIEAIIAEMVQSHIFYKMENLEINGNNVEI